jgi:multidrug efflux pump subunit AcrB
MPRSIQKTVAEMHLPASIQASFQGTAQVFQASLTTMPFLILAALVCRLCRAWDAL